MLAPWPWDSNFKVSTPIMVGHIAMKLMAHSEGKESLNQFSANLPSSPEMSKIYHMSTSLFMGLKASMPIMVAPTDMHLGASGVQGILE